MRVGLVRFPGRIMKILLTVVLLLASFAAQAQACSRQSPAHTIALVELFTSEGCDSCPPADRYLSSLKTRLRADQMVALSLHVDYWDYIGWKDVFARPAFTERQRWLAAAVNSRAVYTPQVFMAGRELRQWQTLPEAVAKVNARPSRAQIGIVLGQPVKGSLPVTVNAGSAQAGKLIVALYENSLVSEVKAGENRGVTLRHDHVVREWLSPVALAANAARLTQSVSLPVGAAMANLGVAAFVQAENGEVLQALNLPLCAPGGG